MSVFRLFNAKDLNLLNNYLRPTYKEEARCRIELLEYEPFDELEFPSSGSTQASGKLPSFLVDIFMP